MNDLKDLENFLLNFDKEVTKEVNDILDEEVKKAKKELVEKSPGSGDYKKGWRISTKTKNGKKEKTIYNKDHYRLTHLLEDGHTIANQYGKTPYKTRPQPHIRPVEDELIKRVEERIDEVLDKKR